MHVLGRGNTINWLLVSSTWSLCTLGNQLRAAWRHAEDETATSLSFVLRRMGDKTDFVREKVEAQVPKPISPNCSTRRKLERPFASCL